MVRYGQEPVFLTTGPDGGSYLSCCEEASEGYVSVPATADDLDGRVVAEFLDQQEENANRHELVGAYFALLGIVTECSNQTVARKVMIRLMERAGLTV